MAGEHRWGTVSGASSPDVLGGRVGIWARRHKADTLKCYRVVREGELLADFEPGPKAPQEIGEFASNIAESEGQPVTIEIHAIVATDTGAERTAQVMHLRAVPAPALAVSAGSDAALAVVLNGYAQLQKSQVEMLGSISALVKQQGDSMRQLMEDASRRETSLRDENEKLHELVRSALDTAREASTGENRKSVTQRLEDVVLPIVGDAARRVIGNAIGVDLSDPAAVAAARRAAGAAVAEAVEDAVTGTVVNGSPRGDA